MLTILNDIHAGAIRSAGTTPATQLQLRQTTTQRLKALLPTSGDLLLNGDLFDTNNVPLVDMLEVYQLLNDWLRTGTGTLYNSFGNHDASKTSNVLSSFQFLGRLLSQHGNRYVHIEEPTMTPWGYVLPHMLNQEQFDIALGKVPQCTYLFVHCNYDNHFAAQSDQSLNISEAQAFASKAKWIVFGHEHHPRDIGKVLVPGNQIATSVSDWLQPTDKRFLVIADDFSRSYSIAAKRADEFAEVGYADLATYEGKASFIRVVGSTEAENTSAVLTAINKFRRASDALVVTNAVHIETAGQVVKFDEVLKSAESFSVMQALKPYFTADEYKVLESLCS